MVVLQVSEGLLIKETATATDYVELFYHDHYAYAWVKGNMTRLDPIDKLPAEYTWNELRDLLDKLKETITAG